MQQMNNGGSGNHGYQRGYETFVKTVSGDIMRMNPKTQGNPAEVNRIVAEAWQ